MDKKSNHHYTLLIIMVSLLLCSCGRKAAQDVPEAPYVIGVVTKSGTSEYWMSIGSGMEAAAKETGAKVLILSPDSEINGEAQTKMVKTLLRKHVDVLAVSPIDSDGAKEYFSMAEEMGIPIISYDTPYSNPDIPYIGIDNEKAGYELASFLAEQLGHEGEVGIIVGDLEQLSHRQRMDGFIKYMDTEQNMKVAFVESGYSNLRMSEKEIHRLREQYPDVKGIMATSAVTALGIVEGISEDDVCIVSIDAQEDAIAALQNGRIAALIAQSGYEIGYETAKYIDEFRDGAEKDRTLILEAELLTGENVDVYVEKKSSEKGRLR